jgi:glycine betaine/proline transport system ATP-binding protein
MQGGEIAQIGTPEEIRSFFKGVDVTSVLTAEHIVKKSNATLINKQGMGIKSALQYLGDYDRDIGYVIEKTNKYVGLVSLESLEEAKKQNKTLQEALIEQDTISIDMQINDCISIVANAKYPVAVVDAQGRYKGTISKSMLLKAIDEGVENE